MKKSCSPPILNYDAASRRWQPGTRPLIREVPLEIKVNAQLLTTLHRTPGNEKRLATGFLFYQGLIEAAAGIKSSSLIPGHREPGRPLTADTLEMVLEAAPAGRLERRTAAAVWSALVPRLSDRQPPEPFLLPPELIPELPDRMFARQQLYESTAGAHAVALLDAAGTILHCEEDVGRTNALDKIVGYCLEQELDRTRVAALFSGRINLEMAVKIARAGFPLVLSISAPTAAAVEILKQIGITYIGSLQKKPLTLFCGTPPGT